MTISTIEHLVIEVIDSGTPTTSGYVRTSGNSGAEHDRTDGFPIISGAIANPFSGIMRLVRTETGVWVQSHSSSRGVAEASGGGDITGVTSLTGIRLTRVSSGTFSAGSFVISWR